MRSSWVVLVLALLVVRMTSASPKHRRHADARPSFVEFHTARVKHDLMMFHPDYPGLLVALRRDDTASRVAGESEFSFVSPSRADDPFEVTRQRDRLRLFRDPSRQASSTALGLGVFTAMTMMSAHLPGPLRVIFDGSVHAGPAIFDDGGMGAGISGAVP